MDPIKKWEDRTREEVSERKEALRKRMAELGNEGSDRLAADADEEARKIIDCLKCANCCKTTVTTFTESDIRLVSSKLGLSVKAFKKTYLMHDMEEWVTLSTPCPFLSQDNSCSIYEFRPAACRSFPHTQRAGFSKRKRAHFANLDVCPITYFVVESMVKTL